MKNVIWVVGLFVAVVACATKSSPVASSAPATDKVVAKNDTVRIANDSLEYEVIVIDAGFNTWLVSRAKPRQYYGLNYLEVRNKLYVMEWNRRVLEPMRYNPDLYLLRIDYDPRISYGYEVNYLLYNYFMYFQQQYRQKL